MEEEEFQSQLMARGHYMIDEDESSNPHHEQPPPHWRVKTLLRRLLMSQV